MMESISGQLNLGAFNITMPERWDAQFFPSIETKLRLVKRAGERVDARIYSSYTE